MCGLSGAKPKANLDELHTDQNKLSDTNCIKYRNHLKEFMHVKKASPI